jgi:hypothetical protein
MDKVQKPIITQCYTPSSKPYRIYLKQCCFQLSGVTGQKKVGYVHILRASKIKASLIQTSEKKNT